VVQVTSEPIFEPQPGNDSNDSIPLDFNALQAETTEPIVPHSVPNPNADKKVPWWRKSGRDIAGEAKKKERTQKTSSTPRMSDAALIAALESFYAGMSLAAMPFCMHCAQNIGNNASQCAGAMVEWSKTNPAIRRFLVNMVAISAGGKVIAAHSAMLMPIAMHHVPVLRERQEKMAADMGEMFARMAAENPEGRPE
jgi:hypothetical protein